MKNAENTAHDTSLRSRAEAIAPPTAQERLHASRAALQAWIAATYHPQPKAERKRAAASHQTAWKPEDPGWLSILADSLTDVPAAKIAMRWARRWWAHHPWRATADFASVATRELIGPTAARHPWLVVGGAVVAGGLLAQLRPWRWVSAGALLSGFLPRFDLTSLLHVVTTTLHGLHPGGSRADARADAAEQRWAQNQASPEATRSAEKAAAPEEKIAA